MYSSSNKVRAILSSNCSSTRNSPTHALMSWKRHLANESRECNAWCTAVCNSQR